MATQGWGIPVDRVRFGRRGTRPAYLVEHFGEYLGGSVLDVGCDRAALRELLAGVRYTGVDVGGSADVRLDLDRTEHLPFPDGAFECVVCLDVLEHLEALHRTFAELVRVAARHLIVSLPNCWVTARVPIRRGRGSFAHYGLPPEPPTDRHRWFFNLQQARAFVRDQARRRDLRVAAERICEKPKAWPIRLLRRLRYPPRVWYLNRYAHTYWAVLEKPAATGPAGSS